MKKTYPTLLAVILLLASSNQSMAQNSLFQDADSFGNDDGMSWNVSYYQFNAWDNGQFFDSIENHYFWSSDNSEPIDEIVVRAKRNAARRMFLADLWSQIDVFYVMELARAQQSECQMIRSVDPGTYCLNETDESTCVTSTFTVPSLSHQQALELNTEYTILRQVDNASSSLEVGLIAGILTGGMGQTASVVTSLLAVAGTYVAGLPNREEINPFRQGDSFVLTMTACPAAGFDEVPTFSTTVEYTGG